MCLLTSIKLGGRSFKRSERVLFRSNEVTVPSDDETDTSCKSDCVFKGVKITIAAVLTLVF